MLKNTHLIACFVIFIFSLFRGDVFAQSADFLTDFPNSQVQDTTVVFQPLDPLIFKKNIQGSTEFSDSIRKTVIVNNTQELFVWMQFMEDFKQELLSNDHTGLYQSQNYSLRREEGGNKFNREQWIVFWLIFLVFFLGIIRYVFSGYTAYLIYSYYQDTAFSQITKEDNQFTSWPFLFSYLLSGLTLGLFIYVTLTSGYFNNSFPIGFDNYLILSLSLILLLSLKILSTKFIAFVFESQKIIRQYIVTIYLSYINVGLIALPMVFAMAFLPFDNLKWIIPVTGVLIIIVLLYRVIKVLMDLFTNYRFSKFYLIVYLCTLELSPILVLLKLIYR